MANAINGGSTSGVLTVGPVLVVGLYALLAFNVHVFFGSFLPVLVQLYGGWGHTLALLGIIIVCNLAYNHVCACLVSPGTLGELRSCFRTGILPRPNHALRCNPSRELKHLLSLADRGPENLRGWKANCKACKAPKPVRFHHCRVCKVCVSAMDHHCPWINCCLGHFNQRYFLLFLFYLVIGSAFMVSTRALFSHTTHLEGTNVLTVTLALNWSLLIVMGALTAWNWYLCLSG